MKDIPFASPETPSPLRRPDLCPRCNALADRWVYVGGKMFLCTDCHAELSQTSEPVNVRVVALEELTHARRSEGVTAPSVRQGYHNPGAAAQRGQGGRSLACRGREARKDPLKHL
jgi:hypothetical protein